MSDDVDYRTMQFPMIERELERQRLGPDPDKDAAAERRSDELSDELLERSRRPFAEYYGTCQRV